MYMISSVNEVKNHNVSLVINTLSSIPYGTTNTISKITGLSIATCNTILNELLEKELILLRETEMPPAGRPPKVFKFNKNFSYILCVYPTYESGVKKINYAVTNLLGDIVSQSCLVFDYITYDVIERIIKDRITEESKINTICFGIPGYYFKSKIQSCGIEELNGCDIINNLKNSFDCNVYAENDMNAMAYGIYNHSEDFSEDMNDLVLISFFKDRGTGSSIILNGRIISGTTNFAGEINYLPYTNNDVVNVTNDTKDRLIDFAINAVCIYTSIINPSRIFFTGENINDSMLSKIKNGAKAFIPPEHLPELFYGNNFHNYYVLGLTAIAVDNTNFNEY